MSGRVMASMSRGLPVVLALALTGCMSLGSKTPEYKARDVAKGPNLEVPPDLTRPGRDDRYQMADVSTPGGAVTASGYGKETVAAARTGDTTVLPAVGQLKIQRSGSERWLVVPQTPQQLWEKVRDFWQDNGFLLKVESPESGILETDWAENHAKLPGGVIRDFLGRFLDTIYSTGERDKYRTRLEPGVEPGTTEIYISHRGMVESLVTNNLGAEGKTMWEPRPADPGLESEFLRRLMVRLGSDETTAKASVEASQSASTAADTSRARVVNAAGGGSVLEVREPFDRAWRRVGLVLDRVGFSVEERDRASGQYLVRYLDPNEGQAPKKTGGFFSALAFWRSEDKKNPAADQYRIELKGRDDQVTEVRVLGKDGAPDATVTAGRILSLLQGQLR
jgi:outer membrane protein assembly factor BamC